MNIKEQIKNDVYEILKDYIKKEDIVIEKPKQREMGDYALPCFTYSKILRKSPNDIALMIKENLKGYEVNVINGYVNLFINKKEFSKNILNEILEQKENYGNSDIGKDKPIQPIGHIDLQTLLKDAIQNVVDNQSQT